MHTHMDPYPRNCILEGPREIIRDASPSPSTRGGGVVSFLWFDQTAGDACGGGTGARRDDHTQTIMSAATHGATSRIHHKADQKPVKQPSSEQARYNDF